MSREIAKEKIRELGGKTSESISEEADYLVAGEEPGSNLAKAKKSGIKILDEKRFLKIISWIVFYWDIVYLVILVIF